MGEHIGPNHFWTRTHHGTVAFPCGGGVLQVERCLLVVDLVQLARQPCQSFAERRAPGLLRRKLGRHAAAAVGTPPLHSVRTTPGAGTHQLHFFGRRRFGEVLGKVAQADSRAFL